MNKQGQLLTNGINVRQLQDAIASGSTYARMVPQLIKLLCPGEQWRDRVDQQTGERYTFPKKEGKTFLDFVEDPPRPGLGSKLDVVKKLCAGDAKAEGALEAAVQGKRTGRPPKLQEKVVSNTHELSSPATGTRARSLRKLRTEAEKSPVVRKVYEQVLAGELSPHRGMVECGFRKVPTALEQIKRLLGKLSARERRTLLGWIQSP